MQLKIHGREFESPHLHQINRNDMPRSIDEFTDKIINGNSFDIIQEIPDESINLIVTSPPYFGLRSYGDETLGREHHPLEYVDNLVNLFDKCRRILSKDGSMYVNLGDVYFGIKNFNEGFGSSSKHRRKTHKHYGKHQIVSEDGKYLQNKQLLLIPPRFAMKMQDKGWLLRNQILWKKPNPVPSFSFDRRIPSYEYVYHFVKSKNYYFDYNLAKKLNHHYDIVECGIEPFSGHQASFPEKFIYPFIVTTSKENDIVLDPFMGSGTVAVICKKKKRHYIGIELNKEYCEKAEIRVLNSETLWT